MIKKSHCVLFLVSASLVVTIGDRTFLRSGFSAETGTRQENASNPRVYSMHDSNQDGFLSRDEYSQLVDKLDRRRQEKGSPKHGFSERATFEEIDTDGDGFISEDELVDTLNKLLRKHRRHRSHGFSS